MFSDMQIRFTKNMEYHQKKTNLRMHYRTSTPQTQQRVWRFITALPHFIPAIQQCPILDTQSTRDTTAV
jgi:hypothetical protein